MQEKVELDNKTKDTNDTNSKDNKNSKDITKSKISNKEIMKSLKTLLNNLISYKKDNKQKTKSIMETISYYKNKLSNQR